MPRMIPRSEDDLMHRPRHPGVQLNRPVDGASRGSAFSCRGRPSYCGSRSANRFLWVLRRQASRRTSGLGLPRVGVYNGHGRALG